MVDIWRQQNAGVQAYTWRKVNSPQRSRIDYMFLTEYMVAQSLTTDSRIDPGIGSDHSMVFCEICLLCYNSPC